MCVLCPVLEDGSGEGARDDEPDDGELRRLSKDLKPSRMVDLDGKRRKLFFWPDMLVVSKDVLFSRIPTVVCTVYPGPFYKYGLAELQLDCSPVTGHNLILDIVDRLPIQTSMLRT
jgi:hypothetical protein